MDANKLIGSHLAIIGNSGAGKSHEIRRLCEASWGQCAQIIFDGEDEFHTLRQQHPYVLIGGDHADIPLRLSDAEALARHIVIGQVSVIIQMNGLYMADRRRYIARFLEAIMGLQRRDWRRVLVVIDEADKYAPQGERVESLQPIINLMAMGRKRGFVGVLATQRAAKISKSAVAECSNWMIGRSIASNDKRVAAEILGLDKAQTSALGDLAPGMFWRFGPAFGRKTLAQSPRSKTAHLAFGEDWFPEPLRPEIIAAVTVRRTVIKAVHRAPPATSSMSGFMATIAAVAVICAGGIWAVSTGVKALGFAF